MAKGNPGIERSGQTGVFTSGKPRFRPAAVAIIVIFAIVACAAVGSNTLSIPAPESAGTVAAVLFFAWIISLRMSRRWTAEIDLAAGRLRILRRSFDRWTKTIADCPLGECRALGTFEYNAEGHLSYGVYIQSKQGVRYDVPLQDNTFDEAARVASQLATATGISRLDIYQGSTGPIILKPP